MKQYDFLVIGSGLFGAVFAREMTRTGKKCLVIEKRKHVGGNVHCENIEGINVHMYGPHVFHTNDKTVWNYVNSFTEFNHFRHNALACFKDSLYNLPFNMNTFHEMWKVKTPSQAEQKIKEQVMQSGIVNPRNLEEQAISMVGIDIYRILIQGYTEKQWGRKATELPGFIIKRLPVRFTYDNNYFNDKYQGMPVGGYNKLTEALLAGIEVRTNVDFFKYRNEFCSMADTVVYTGCLDEFYDYRFGNLEYRSLRFEHEVIDVPNFQGVAVINYTEREIPYTRIVEHKHFEFGTQPVTVITKEYPEEWASGKEPYYPINDEKNNQRLKQYMALAEKEPHTIFGGRLANYKYYDMHQVIAAALKKARTILSYDPGEKNTLFLQDC
jgi:UDP-galactopyranose mutase